MTTENKTVTQETVAPKGQLTFDDKVIQKIVGYAIENVSGLLGVDGGFVANIKNKIVNNPIVNKNGCSIILLNMSAILPYFLIN